MCPPKNTICFAYAMTNDACPTVPFTTPVVDPPSTDKSSNKTTTDKSNKTGSNKSGSNKSAKGSGGDVTPIPDNYYDIPTVPTAEELAAAAEAAAA